MDRIRSRTAVLLLAALLLAALPGAGEDWSKAADSLGLTVWASALREEAYRSYSGNDPAIAAVLAGQWLRQQLDNGLAANAVATFRNLPLAVRTRLEEGPFEMDGIPDLRLELAAAHLLAGDSKGAAALAEKAPSSPLYKSLISLWLQPSSGDPFDLLVTAAGYEHEKGIIFQILLGRLAEREGYPALTEYSLSSVASRMAQWATGESNLSHPLPAHVAAVGRRLEAGLASVRQSLEERAGAASTRSSQNSGAAVQARAAFQELIEPRDRPGGRPAFRRAEPVIELFMIDRAGKRAFGIWYEGPPEGPKGGQIRLEESGGVWKGEIVSSWIA